jgi:hypothetical protein
MARAILLVLPVLALLCSTVSAQSDADILNFALNLECLEAEFYSWAAFGHGLSAADRGNGPASVGGQKALLSTAAQAYAEEIANDEVAHVRFLRSALGSAAVACPLMNIGTAFATAANAAVNATLSPAFSPYGSDTLFYHGAFIFEDVGVTAYHGAAPLISNKATLSAAAGILAVESYHAGIIRLLLAQEADEFVFPYAANVSSIVEAISALRDAADGTTAMEDQGLFVTAMDARVNGTTVGSLNLVPTDSNALAFSRSPSGVLRIVYLGGASSGGFFPNGLNGAVKTATASA